MCLLTYIPPATQPNLSRLADGCEANPDGFGYAIVTGDRIIVGKGLEHESVLLEFMELRREHPEGPALFHSRITTHGATDLENCHPFYVNYGGHGAQTVLAHNGILPARVQPRLGDLRSDTRIAAEDWIPRHMGRVWKSGVRRNIERWMGKGNKMVVLTIDPRSPMSAYILNEEAGHWSQLDGCWYSNQSYMWGGYRWHKPSTPSASEGGLGWPSAKSVPMILGPKQDALEEQSCIVCSAIGWTSSNTICPWCNSCQECLGDSKTCLCNGVDYGDEEDSCGRGLKLPDDGHGACPVCGSYYLCGCTDEDYLDYLMKDDSVSLAEFRAASTGTRRERLEPRDAAGSQGRDRQDRAPRSRWRLRRGTQRRGPARPLGSRGGGGARHQPPSDGAASDRALQARGRTPGTEVDGVATDTLSKWKECATRDAGNDDRRPVTPEGSEDERPARVRVQRGHALRVHVPGSPVGGGP